MFMCDQKMHKLYILHHLFTRGKVIRLKVYPKIISTHKNGVNMIQVSNNIENKGISSIMNDLHSSTKYVDDYICSKMEIHTNVCISFPSEETEHKETIINF